MIPLTPRQIEVLREIARAKSYKVIGADLGIAEKTVVKHVDSIHKKTNIRTNVGLTHYAILAGMVQAGDFVK